MRRRLLIGAVATAALALLVVPVAMAKYRGSDVLGNIAPDPVVGGGLMHRYPLSAFTLDYHVDVGLTDLGGVPATIAQWAAAQMWSVTSFVVKTVIDLFTWAFSLNLLNGGSGGALDPVARAVASLYDNVIGQAWMVVAITAAGLWGIWRALVQRRYTETAGALALSVAFVVIALFFVQQPQQTIGRASQWTNALSLAFLSGTSQGTIDDPGAAKQRVADQLFRTQIFDPWVVLDFGGLAHCVNTHATDDDGFPRPVAKSDPARTVCRNHVKAGADGFGGYAPRFLRSPPGSVERDAEYEALKNGQAPDDDPQFRGYRVDRADAPAVDIQQAGGAYQRLTLAFVIMLGSLGMVVLLGFLSLAVILAQVVALVLLGFAPVALVVGIFPGRGHDFFRTWLAKLATAIFIKALYSLVITIVVAVAGALTAATGSLGFLFSFALEAIFFWAIFLYRRQITTRLVGATTGQHYEERLPYRGAVRRGAALAAHPVGALVSVGRGRGAERGRQESVLATTTTPTGATSTTSTDGRHDRGGAANEHQSGLRPVPVGATAQRSEGGEPPARNGHGAASRPVAVSGGRREGGEPHA